jgi:dihydrodipicolinate synthase/N-acetylneuraminate lyase
MTLLSYEEKVKLFEVAVQEASGKVSVVASTGSSKGLNCTTGNTV